MQPTPEELDGITFPFLNDLFARLNCFIQGSEGETSLWHYTSGSSLIEIVKSNVLFSTQVACLNDSSEVRYATALLREALLEKDLSKLPEETQSEVMAYIEGLIEVPDRPSTRTSEYFVSCFTEADDDLSQWRAYGGGECGVAVRFKAKSLFGGDNIPLVRVNYDETFHRELSKAVADNLVDYLSYGCKLKAENIYPGYFLLRWAAALSHISPIVKNNGFAAEREVRLIRPFKVAEDYSTIKVIARRSMLSMHIPLELPFGRAEDGLLPIEEVMIGPGRHQHVTAVSVHSLLKAKGYLNVPVSTSKRPFQDVS
jgi:hypothetical protein